MAAEVANVVNRCESGKESWSLDLSNCGLKSVPDAIFHLMRNTTVLTCDMSGNQLQKLPAKLAIQFCDMSEFNASGNRLNALPDEFGNLAMLTYLNLSKNRFVKVPEAVYNMVSVTHLDLCNNQLNELDAGKLREMKSLKVINLKNNPLTSENCHQLINFCGIEVKTSHHEVD
ncbi:leucine-rich repeat-containing protein 20-like [Anneissia japonica]|uniref:leucine-rich repeat-containing protein 20-like n=1 Tax=Anneissia japonica TaxID=1529436 RepID=UPI001425858B|nr:leucine-rich repeat-containing protein 20-like [Anneissia japonica]